MTWLPKGPFLAAISVLFLQAAHVRVLTVDQSNQPVADVEIQIQRGGTLIARAVTNALGSAEFGTLSPGNYEVVVEKTGFERLTRTVDDLRSGSTVEIRFALTPKIELKDTVTITGVNDTPVISSGEFQRNQLQQLASRPTTVTDALPLVPGVSRSPDGEINISGSGEHRSALIVNAADVTDPATGQFGMTIPVDSVERLEVYKSPFLAQYGRFTAGVVSVETRRGGDSWNFEVHDPLPGFRFRSGHLAGMLNASPRIVFNGPLIKNRLFFSEGVEYRLFKDPVRTLPHPDREMKSESVNSFTQFDYIASAGHTMTGTAHIAPRKVLYANLNYFDPRPVSPSFSARDYTTTFIDRLNIGPHLLESTVAYKQYGSDVWGQGSEEMTLTPTGNFGSYWNRQDRHASRIEWMEQLSLKPVKWFGSHSLRVGASLVRSNIQGEFLARPVNINDAAGQRIRRIEFEGGQRFDQNDTEVAAYGQDNWVVSPKLSVNFGTRFERQQVSGNLRFAPRFGMVWSPFTGGSTVIRGGFGVFYDRVPLNVYTFPSYPDQVITTYAPGSSILDGPRRFDNVIGTARFDYPFVSSSSRPGGFSPYSTTWKIEGEQTIRNFLRLRAGYLESKSGGIVIFNPVASDVGNALVMNGGGSSRYRQIEVTARLKWREEENLVLTYVRSRARGDLNEFNEYLGNFPSPVIRPNQYSNLTADLPHRFLAYGLVKLPWRMRFAPLIEYRNGFPYAVTNELQQYVGIPNSDQTRFPNFYSFDLRLMKDFDVSYKKKKYTFRLSLVGYNVTNHFNPWDVHRNISDPQFGVFFGRYRRWFKMDFEVFF
jgi:hypothetical protein